MSGKQTQKRVIEGEEMADIVDRWEPVHNIKAEE